MSYTTRPTLHVHYTTHALHWPTLQCITLHIWYTEHALHMPYTCSTLHLPYTTHVLHYICPTLHMVYITHTLHCTCPKLTHALHMHVPHCITLHMSVNMFYTKHLPRTLTLREVHIYSCRCRLLTRNHGPCACAHAFWQWPPRGDRVAQGTPGCD